MTPKTKNDVIKLNVKKSTKVQSFNVDFGAIDEIRELVRKMRREYLKKSRAGKKLRHLYSFSYETASFYIGRNTVHVRFVRINLPEASVTRLAKQLQLVYPDYQIYWQHRDVYVYLRGQPRWHHMTE